MRFDKLYFEVWWNNFYFIPTIHIRRNDPIHMCKNLYFQIDIFMLHWCWVFINTKERL